MISGSRLAELQHVPPAWKFCAVQSQERFDRENAQRADGRKWKTTARPRKTLPGSPDRGREKNKRGRNRAGTTRKDREEVEVLRGSLYGVARVARAAQLHLQLQEAPPAMGATSCGQHVGLRARIVVLEGHERAHQSELGFEQQNRFRNLREKQKIERKLSGRVLTQRKKRAREEPSPGPPASETDAGPPGHQPRGGAPARPRLSRGQEGPT